MKRLNFTFDDDTANLLQELADNYYNGNKSQTVRAALESLASHTGHEGWVIAGYTPVQLNDDKSCHTCGEAHHEGEVLYRPVFERGKSPEAMPAMPSDDWLECPSCAEKHFE